MYEKDLCLEKLHLNFNVLEDFSRKITDFHVKFIKEQVRVANGNIKEMYLFGVVEYKKALLFLPETWVKIFKPCLKRLCKLFSLSWIKSYIAQL